ncbi:MAG: hypothetical protein E5Y73_09735 [Mesorhizobium sp.]|uniref:hypothetical protein n=1 Tax=Mesorhizobium sp. TaxID=1871066 RepID=UPI0011FA9E52|nr:hypothetical protein [Mesorhizobium sp.]TIL94805.1 MAG: hypothetical protein E5Y73_09735 [Mesorhizobium sp.]
MSNALLAAKFRHQLGDPLVDLIRRAAANIIIEPGASDVLTMATNLTVQASHFHEATGHPPPTTGLLTALHTIMKDAADSIKHGTLRKASRQTSFQTALEFDVKGKQYRFFRTAIWAKSAGAGEFDLVETLKDYCLLLAKDLNIVWESTFVLQDHQFADVATIVVGDKNPNPQSCRYYLYEFDEAKQERRQLDNIPAGFSLRIENRSQDDWTRQRGF